LTEAARWLEQCQRELAAGLKLSRPVFRLFGFAGTGKTTLCRLLLEHCPAEEGKPHVVIEAVRAMGGKDNSVQTQGSLLRTLGALEAVVECLRFPVAYVPPQTWKKFFGLIDSDLSPAQRKAKALDCARKLYPGCADIGLAKHHNRAEAILVAHWQMRATT
jgi:crossover junction endodeoxyribonuclease RuvC